MGVPSSIADVCRFNSTSGGTSDWAYSSAVVGYQGPGAAGMVNGAQYSYRAENTDLSQWEVGVGIYNSATGVLTRSVVLFNSAGNTAKINFSAAPQVAIVALAEDLFSFNSAMSLTSAQKLQAHANIFVPPTRTVLTGGSGTYYRPAGVKWINVRQGGGGGGGMGGGASTSGGAGSDGGDTTFGSHVAKGGKGAATVNAGGAGGGGTIASGAVGAVITGATGSGGAQAPASGGYFNGGQGGSSMFGGGGGGAGAGTSGYAGAPNTGGGGGGGSSSAGGASINHGGGGGAGGGLDLLISSPDASYPWSVGPGGAAGAAGAGGTPGGPGGSGVIIVDEFYGS